MIRVLVASPLTAPTEDEIQRNKIYAKRAVWDSLKRGEAPYASHVLFAQDQLLDDHIPRERNLGMSVGMEWGRMAHKIAVYCDRGISKGMQMEIDFYRHCGIPVEHRYMDTVMDDDKES